jgi:predicted O-linked N-acetylglucosamine transferase (SPINDLY family)
MGKMMWQAIAHHDRVQFEVHIYSMSNVRDDWTERFAGFATRFSDVSAHGDAAAAARIAEDDLDILVDLATHTRGARPGILAQKPARVQITHVASAGTLGLSAIDFKLTDHYADVPGNEAFQIERMLLMEGCVYPYRYVAPTVEHLFDRVTLGIAADAFVIGAFVTPLKLSRRCLALWGEVLQRIPRAVLAFSPANPALRGSYLRLAGAVGIGEDRIVFIPQGRDDSENQARYRVVDIVLDTMPFGGVNGTIEALAMLVPVVTLVGRRHGERTTYSILANLGVTETVAQSGREYVAIAQRLADDPEFCAQVKQRIAFGIEDSPLVDMEQHARNLEAAYLRAMLPGDPAIAAR